MPSIKTITERLGEAIAHEHGEPNVRPIASMMRAMMKNAKTPQMVDLALDFFNDVLGGCGVEVIRGEHVNQYYMDINLLYVNMGSFDVGTMIYDTLNECWYITNIENLITSQPKRFD